MFNKLQNNARAVRDTTYVCFLASSFSSILFLQSFSFFYFFIATATARYVYRDAIFTQSREMIDYLDTTYQTLQVGVRSTDHEGGGYKIPLLQKYPMNSFFMQDLKAEFDNNKKVFVAAGHSMYWNEFLKKYSSGPGCKVARDLKLYNGGMCSLFCFCFFL